MPTENKNNFLYGELTYKINGVLIEVHKELGKYAREKQVCDLIEVKFKNKNISFQREVRIGDSGNIVDFIVEGKVVLELKTRPFLILEHYDQVKRYLSESNLQLGLLVNFRTERLQIKRILNPNNL